MSGQGAIKTIDLNVRLAFDELPRDVRVVDVSVDWNGDLLIGCDEGKPPRPPRTGSADSFQAELDWINSPPAAFRVIEFSNDKKVEHRWANIWGTSGIGSVQRFGRGWITQLGAVLDKDGKFVKEIDFESGVESVQTTEDGHIWVSYFDEGIFSNGKVAPSGLVCFDSAGEIVFRYGEFAEKHHLPHIDDCYTLNVIGDDVWLSYYSDFPLVHLRNFTLNGIWRDFRPSKAVAVRGDRLIVFPAYHSPYLVSRGLDSKEETVLHLNGKNGSLSTPIGELDSDGQPYFVPFYCVARGRRMFVVCQDAVYEVPELHDDMKGHR